MVTDFSTVATKFIHESNEEGFVEVKDKLNSIYDVVSKKTLEKVVMQEFSSISTEPRVRNVQVPLTVIDTASE